MWFKNARIFRLPDDFSIDSEKLSEQLTHDTLKPCGPQDISSQGWISPFNMLSEIFCWQCGNAQFITLAIEEKILPPSVVNQQVQDKVARIKSDTGSKPGRKAQSDMKQELLFELLPQAFTKLKKIGAYIDNNLKLLVVDSASPNPAENLVSQLRQTLGSFKATAFDESSVMAGILTRWITEGRAEGGFEFGSSLVLQTFDDAKSVIRAKNVNYLTDEMQQHIDNGYLVTQIGLVFNDRIELTLTHDFAVKSIKFTDMVLDDLGRESIESEEQLLDSRFSMLSLELRELYLSLFNLFAKAM
ncbi:DNA recombination-dependent growth factor C [hydrothermal vent metagenome]|uniref:DNA recombination-dependent growth factor C n=1 Tax=hydrothermal vent metagenome TaxID=652676 RepID=A0A3B0WCR2_9ZZZZ